MHYKMKVTIAPVKDSIEPDSPEKTLNLDATFAIHDTSYGNKHYLYIKGDHGFAASYDIRYDRDFHPNRKAEYLKDWANWYWSGKDGAWKVKSIEVEHVGE